MGLNSTGLKLQWVQVVRVESALVEIAWGETSWHHFMIIITLNWKYLRVNLHASEKKNDDGEKEQNARNNCQNDYPGTFGWKKTSKYVINLNQTINNDGITFFNP